MAVYESPADEPKTDRDWLIMVAGDVKSIKRKLDDICDIQKKHQGDIDELKKWRIYQAAILVILILLITGRYIFGPTSFPLVP